MDANDPKFREYLGDGLMASYEGWHVILSTQRETGLHWVALDPAVIKAFQNYLIQLETVLNNIQTERASNGKSKD